MKSLQISAGEFQAANNEFPANTPVVMLNLMRYREQADYGGRTNVVPCSGREAFRERFAIPAAKILRNLGGRVFWFGKVQKALFAPADEHWDDVLLMEYPSFDCVLELVGNSDYKANVFHRDAALMDRRVIATVTGSEIA